MRLFKKINKWIRQNTYQFRIKTISMVPIVWIYYRCLLYLKRNLIPDVSYFHINTVLIQREMWERLLVFYALRLLIFVNQISCLPYITIIFHVWFVLLAAIFYRQVQRIYAIYALQMAVDSFCYLYFINF